MMKKDRYVELVSQTAPWEVYPMLPQNMFEVYKSAGIEDIHAQLLHNRGITTAAAMRSFLDACYNDIPNPLTLIDMDKALLRIQQALSQHEHITVYGDYDADGVTSSALLFRALYTLKHSTARLDFHIPSRLHDGCGLNLKAIDRLYAQGTSLIITTDCASSDVEQVAYARKLGIDVIITDHHQPPGQLPAAYAMINPWRPDCTYRERYLCGVGIAFKLAQALYRVYQRPVEEEIDLLDLVAVGTVADVAPLLGENHTLVRLGLQKLNATRKPGLVALIRRAGLQAGRIRERDIAFALAPRINAAGRMKDANTAFKLLTTDDPAEAATYVEELETLNLSRQRHTEELMSSARLAAQQRHSDAVVLVSGDNWPEGIIGLVAGKLAQEIQRPVLVLSRGSEYSRGSARSAKGLNIISALRGCADILVRYGGHAQAAGFTIANDRIEELRAHLLHWREKDPASPVSSEAAEIVNETGMTLEQESAGASAPPQMVDIVLTRLERLNYHLYNKVRALSPFGAANPDPIFKIERMRVLRSWASGSDRRTLSLLLGKGNFQYRGKLLRGSTQLSIYTKDLIVNIVFSLEAVWNPGDEASREEIWLKILHIEPAGPFSSPAL
jgi:single-stranded-DNA-specific exonuclease